MLLLLCLVYVAAVAVVAVVVVVEVMILKATWKGIVLCGLYIMPWRLCHGRRDAKMKIGQIEV